MKIPFESVKKADVLFGDSRWLAPQYMQKIMYKSFRLKKNQTNGLVDLDKVENDVVFKLRKFLNSRGKLLTRRRKMFLLSDYDAVVDTILNG